jgi:hypothetical protein
MEGESRIMTFYKDLDSHKNLSLIKKFMIIYSDLLKKRRDFIKISKESKKQKGKRSLNWK